MLVCIVKYSCLFIGSQRLFEVRNLFSLSLLVKSPTNRNKNLYRVTPQIDTSGTILVLAGYPDPILNCYVAYHPTHVANDGVTEG